MQREDTQHAPATRVHAQSRNMASPASRDKEKAHRNRRAHTGARRLGSVPTEADPLTCPGFSST